MSIDNTALIPRAQLFGNPERGGCQISPCGKWLAFVAPDQGVMNLWVADRTADVADGLASARCITADRNRGIHGFAWTHDGLHLLYMQDANGDENHHVFAVPVTGGEARNLTPYAGARSSIEGVSRRRPGEVLVSINKRDPRFADLYRVTLATGETRLVRENPGYFGFISDDDLEPRVAVAPQPDGGRTVLRIQGSEATPWIHIAADDAPNSFPVGLSADGRTLYLLDSSGRDKAALVSCDLDDPRATKTLIAQHHGADIGGLWSDPRTREPLGWTADVERREIHVLNACIQDDVAYLNAQELGEWRVVSQTDDETLWIVRASRDTNPATYYLYERSRAKLTKLYDAIPALVTAPLARMQHTTIKSRDGLDMVVYLTLPVHADVPSQPLASAAPVPLVLFVHGGPRARDYWGFEPHHQWLANRGYAVLSLNYRGSTGYGKDFIKAGFGQWGAKMDDDLVDAVRWAIDRGIADARRVCIMGASYGGYATLWSMTANPDLYACGVDVVGPSNLETLADSIPPYWEAAKVSFFQMIGDSTTPEGRALQRERSPVHRAARIAKPLLIGQGANDPRVKQAESDQMVAAMKAKGIPVTYVLFPDEGHGFHRPANSIYFNTITERFLAKYLGGRFEDDQPEETEGHTAVIVEDSLH